MVAPTYCRGVTSRCVMPARASPSSPANPVALAVGGMIALAAAVGVGRFVYTPILPAMVQALQLTRAEAGLIASANFLGYLLGALAAATPLLSGARHRWLLTALIVCTATTGAMGLAAALPMFLLLRLIGGAASAFVLVLSSSIVLDRLTGIGRAHLSSIHFAGVGVGIAVSALVVSTLLHIGAGWPTLWYGVGALMLCATVAVAWLLPPESSGHTTTRSTVAAAWPAALRRLIIAYGLFGFGYVITATFLVAIVRASPQARAIEPLIWLVVGVTAAPSVGLWAKVGARYGLHNAFSVACVLKLAGVAASIYWPTSAGALLAAILLGGTFMGLTSLGLAEARALVPGNPRQAFALMTAAFGLGQIVGPALAGLLSDRYGGYALPSLLAAGALIAAAVTVKIRRRAAPL